MRYRAQFNDTPGPWFLLCRDNALQPQNSRKVCRRRSTQHLQNVEARTSGCRLASWRSSTWAVHNINRRRGQLRRWLGEFEGYEGQIGQKRAKVQIPGACNEATGLQYNWLPPATWKMVICLIKEPVKGVHQLTWYRHHDTQHQNLMTNDKLRNGAGCVRHLCGLSAYKMNREANDCQCFPCNPSSPHSLAPSMCHAQCTATTPLLGTHSDFCHSHFSRQEVTQQPSGRTRLKEKKDAISQIWSLPETSRDRLESVSQEHCGFTAQRPSPFLLLLGRGGSGLPSAAVGLHLCFWLVHLQEMTKV